MEEIALHYYLVLVDVPLLGGEGLYTYKSGEVLKTGEKVLVPFGRRNRIVEGYVVCPSPAKDGAKEIISHTGWVYFDSIRGELIKWLFENYLPSPKQVIGFLSPETLDRSLTRVVLSAPLNFPGKGLKRKSGLMKTVQFLQDSGGEASVLEIPQTRSLFESNFFEMRREDLREQEPRDDNIKPFLFWAPWKEQSNFLVRLLKQSFNQGSQALVLVPESSLIPPLRNLFEKNGIEAHSYFGGENKMRRAKVFYSAQKSTPLLILGTWLSLFLPFFNLKLICILQEENPSYRVLTPPHFSAVRLSKILAGKSGASLYFFSRSPSSETFLEAYKERSMIKKEDPPLRREIFYYKGDQGLSPEISYQVKRNSALGKRTLIFLNRKGMANVLFCGDCGENFECPSCEIPLTPHREEMLCHYCGFRMETPSICPKCKGFNLKTRGIGLERVEAQLRDFQGGKIILVNSEVARNKEAVRLRIEEFKKDRSSILLGTSIIRGHAIPPVSLVVIVNLDFLIGLPFYSASEKAFQLYKNLKSIASEKVILQVSRKIDLDWLDGEFYLEELKSRKQGGFPPYQRIVRVLFEDPDRESAQSFSQKCANFLREDESLLVTGPLPCFRPRIKGRWRMEVLVRFPWGKIPGKIKGLTFLPFLRKANMKIECDPEELD
ncbi:MAG: primosomal protein N' [Caldiserica bacterium]|nr:primosomal protein N' [Caldisericota bacterium]MDH7562965.1 primosomal protein N' [Caldisericota bacterium]